MIVDASRLTTITIMTKQELLTAACPVIGDLGSAFYFIPDTAAVGKELGLRGMEFYILGRGGPMGNCEGETVAAAFGFFKPSMLSGIWSDAAAKVDPRTAGRAHLECCAQLGRNKLSKIENLEKIVSALDAVNNAADPDGLSLYAAMRTEPLASDAPGRAMQLIALLREFRGSAHIVALRANLVDLKTAHFIKRPDMFKTFGYTEEETPVVTDATHANMAAAEKLTDVIVEPAYAVLTDDQRTVLVKGLQDMKAALKAE